MTDKFSPTKNIFERENCETSQELQMLSNVFSWPDPESCLWQTCKTKLPKLWCDFPSKLVICLRVKSVLPETVNKWWPFPLCGSSVQFYSWVFQFLISIDWSSRASLIICICICISYIYTVLQNFNSFTQSITPELNFTPRNNFGT